MLLEVAYPQGSRIGIWKCWILRRRDDWSTRSTRRRDLNPGHIGGSRVLSLLRIPYCRSIHIVNKRVDGTLKIWIQCSARFPHVDDFAMPQHCFVRFIARHILVLMANNLVMFYIYLISLSRNRGRGGTYISDIGMCRPKGYGLGAFLVWKKVYTLPILVRNQVWFCREWMKLFIVSILRNMRIRNGLEEFLFSWAK